MSRPVDIKADDIELVHDMPVRLSLTADRWSVLIVERDGETHYLGTVEDHGDHSYYVRNGLPDGIAHSARYFHGANGREEAARAVAAYQLGESR